MPVSGNVVFRDRIHQVLPMENEESSKDDDSGADDNLDVRNIAEENEAQDDCPDKQAILERSQERSRRELQGSGYQHMSATGDNAEGEHRAEIER
jgi:hypothetical protein